MSAYILFTESMVRLTPNAVTMNGHEHVTIGVTAPTAITKHCHRDARTGRRETALYVPTGFSGRFLVTVATDFPKRQKNAARIHRLGVSVEKGVIVGVTNLDSDRLPYVEVRFPSGYWGELGTNWSASDWEVWVDLPTGWDNE